MPRWLKHLILNCHPNVITYSNGDQDRSWWETRRWLSSLESCQGHEVLSKIPGAAYVPRLEFPASETKWQWNSFFQTVDRAQWRWTLSQMRFFFCLNPLFLTHFKHIGKYFPLLTPRKQSAKHLLPLWVHVSEMKTDSSGLRAWWMFQSETRTFLDFRQLQ